MGNTPTVSQVHKKGQYPERNMIFGLQLNEPEAEFAFIFGYGNSMSFFFLVSDESVYHSTTVLSEEHKITK